MDELCSATFFIFFPSCKYLFSSKIIKTLTTEQQCVFVVGGLGLFSLAFGGSCASKSKVVPFRLEDWPGINSTNDRRLYMWEQFVRQENPLVNMENVFFLIIRPICNSTFVNDHSYVISTGNFMQCAGRLGPVGSPGLTTNNQRLSSADHTAL